MTTSSTPEVAEYTAGSVRILKDVNHIRVRPGMYIGDTGSRGLHNMTFEVIDLALEETREGGGNRIEVTLLRDGGCRVLDNGAGIPVQIDDELQRPYVEAAMTCWLSSRFEKGRYRCHSGPPCTTSAGMRPTPSRRLVVEVQRDGCLWPQEHERGRPLAPLECVRPSATTGTSITFWPDEEIFKENRDFSYLTFSERFRDLAWLIPGLSLSIRDERVEPALEETFCSDDGVVGLLRGNTRGLKAIHPTIVQGRMKTAEIEVELAVAWFAREEEGWRTFVNTTPTQQGGTHFRGLREGVTRAIRALLRNKAGTNSPPVVPPEDIRRGLFFVIVVHLEDPQFASALRDRLNNVEVIQHVAALTRRMLAEFLRQQPDEAAAIMGHIRNPRMVDRKTGES